MAADGSRLSIYDPRIIFSIFRVNWYSNNYILIINFLNKIVIDTWHFTDIWISYRIDQCNSTMEDAIFIFECKRIASIIRCR